jgi:exonuclease III
VQARRSSLPGVLLGDLNAVEGTAALAALTDAGLIDAFRAVNPAAPGPTVWQRIDAPESTVRRRVDYVFLVPGLEVAGRVAASRVVLDTPGRGPEGRPLWLSDHRGVLAELRLASPSTAATAVGSGHR